MSYIMKKITILIGSFKPPHKGHFYMLEKMLALTNHKKIQELYIFLYLTKKKNLVII